MDCKHEPKIEDDAARGDVYEEDNEVWRVRQDSECKHCGAHMWRDVGVQITWPTWGVEE